MPAELARIEIFLRREFLADFQNWARSRGASTQMAGGELLESELVEFRARKVTQLTRRELERPAPTVESRTDLRRTSPEVIQCIVHLLPTMNNADISRRVGTPASTVARIRRKFEENANHVSTNTGVRRIRRPTALCKSHFFHLR